MGVSDYPTQGYALVPSVFSAATVAAMNAALVGISDAAPAWRGPWMDPNEPATLIARHNVHLHAPWDAAVQHPALIDAVTEAMGSIPIFDISTLIAKPPETGQAFPLHQDAAYYAGDDSNYVIATVLLDDATSENGSLRVVPGSHRRGLILHTAAGTSGRKHLPATEYILLEDSVCVGGRAGDVVLMSHFTVHGSQPNRSAAVRRTVRLGYRSRPRAD